MSSEPGFFSAVRPVRLLFIRLLFIRMLASVFASVLLLTACDETPGPSPEAAPPVVVDFAYSPDSADAATLDPSRVTDSTVTVNLRLVTSVVDEDSEIDRVAFTIEPAASPGSTIDGTLPLLPDETRVYGTAIDLTLPRVDALYTLRVFAVDADSLVSNPALGQLRVLPGGDAP